MLPPEVLWTPSLRDQLSPGLEIFLRNTVVLSNATTVTASFTVPSDRILVLTSYSAVAQFAAGVGNSLTRLRTFVSTPAPQELINIDDTGTIAVAVNTVRALSRICEIWVPASGIVQARANFAVADASNQVDFDITGLLIPRGNVLSASG